MPGATRQVTVGVDDVPTTQALLDADSGMGWSFQRYQVPQLDDFMEKGWMGWMEMEWFCWVFDRKAPMIWENPMVEDFPSNPLMDGMDDGKIWRCPKPLRYVPLNSWMVCNVFVQWKSL